MSDETEPTEPTESVEPKETPEEKPAAAAEPVKSDEPAENTQGAVEMFDRAERKALEEQKKKEEEAKKPKKTKDEITESLRQTKRATAARKKKSKRYFQIGGGLVGAYVLYTLYGFLFNPFLGSPTYGACKVFLEKHVRFPHLLEYSGLQDTGDSVRIWYSRVDPFGYRRLEVMRCYLRYEESLGRAVFDRITIDRREIDPEKIEAFNRVLPVVMQNLPDLELPAAPSDKNLNALQIDRTAGRKPIF